MRHVKLKLVNVYVSQDGRVDDATNHVYREPLGISVNKSARVAKIYHVIISTVTASVLLAIQGWHVNNLVPPDPSALIVEVLALVGQTLSVTMLQENADVGQD